MKLFDRMERTWTAIAFAEGGEFETARHIMREESRIEARKRALNRQTITARLELRAPSPPRR